MDKLFQDENKIKIFAQIQKRINDLNPNSSDEEITQIIDEIPKNYLDQKDELMTICQLFAYYARYKHISKKKNAIKLIRQIINPIKTHLGGESTFFWNIFGGLFYFKLWFYEEGLISIDQIIQSSQEDSTFTTSEFFYPEIFEKKPKIFEEETKYQLKSEYSKEHMDDFKKARKKYFDWLLNSGDFNDPSFLEIEKDQLRLSIKKDDFDTFQKLLSKSNLSINSKIQESVIQNSFRYPHEIPLIDFAIYHGSINIFKFLIMQNADLNSNSLIYSLIRSENYEIIHIIEKKLSKKFEKLALFNSISCWNQELIDYMIDNYNYNFLLEKCEVIDKSQVMELLYYTFYSTNFIFFESTLLPFLRNNKDFVEKNIYDIISSTFCDMSCYFTSEFFKFPNIDFNFLHKCNENEFTLLGMTIQNANFKAFEMILKNQNIKINEPVFNGLPAFHFACKCVINTIFLKLLSSYPNFDINAKDNIDSDTAFSICLVNGNFMAVEFITSNFANCLVEESEFSFYFYAGLFGNHIFMLKNVIEFLFKNFYNSKVNDELVDFLVKKFDSEFSQQPDYKKEFVETFEKIIHEVKNQMYK